MVWARNKLKLMDDIYDADGKKTELTFHYSGPHPERFYAKCRELFERIFKTPAEYIQEKDYSWEKLGSKEKFSVNWRAVTHMDRYSYLIFNVSMKGFTENGQGSVTISFEPELWTEYPQDSLWEQSLFYEMLRVIWHKLFYVKKRQEYQITARRMTEAFGEELKKFAEELKASS